MDGMKQTKKLIFIQPKLKQVMNKFSVEERIRIIPANPLDGKRFPDYIAGRSGVIEEVRGRISDPMDHPERPALYLVRFEIDQDSKKGNSKHSILVEVFEDWIIRESGDKIRK